jgi:hypothetical protein
MTKTSKPAAASSAVIVFGLSAIGKPKAGLFKASDAAAARKAATKLGLKTLDTSTPAALRLIGKVPVGRIQAHGDAVVPFVTKDLYEQITAADPSGDEPPNEPRNCITAAKQPRLPADWDDIKTGDCVLSRDSDPADGWWQATVTDKHGDIISLRWPRSDRGRPFTKHRTMLGLICPAAGVTTAKGDTKADGARYPKSWAQLATNQIVLTKEDGPCEQWWEAKVIKIDNQVVTLQWRDYPALPPIIRPLQLIGLMHPSPKAR